MPIINISGVIGWDVNPSEFVLSLDKAVASKEKTEIRINSGGGSVYAGWQMHSAIRRAVQKDAEIDIINDSFSGSMATILMTAIPKNSPNGKVKMQRTAMHFIHMPSGFAWGTEDEMELEQEHVKKIGDIGSSMYSERTGLNKDFCLKVMRSNAYFTAEECLTMGFVDEVVDGDVSTEPIPVRQMSDLYKEAPNNVKAMLLFANNQPNLEIVNKNGLYTPLNNKSIMFEESWKKFLKHLG